MRGLEHAAARLHRAGADAKLFGLQYTRTTSFSHFWRHCDYADSIAAIATNQAAIAGLFRRLNRYVGNLPPMPGRFPDYPAAVIRNVGRTEL